MAILRLVRARVEREAVVGNGVLRVLVQRGEAGAVGPVLFQRILVRGRLFFNGIAKLQRLFWLVGEGRGLKD